MVQRGLSKITANGLQIGEEAETDANLEHQPFGFTEQFIWNTKRLFLPMCCYRMPFSRI